MLGNSGEEKLIQFHVHIIMGVALREQSTYGLVPTAFPPFSFGQKLDSGKTCECGLLRFSSSVCVQCNIAEEREKRGRPGLIHYMRDIRWMRCGHIMT